MIVEIVRPTLEIVPWDSMDYLLSSCVEVTERQSGTGSFPIVKIVVGGWRILGWSLCEGHLGWTLGAEALAHCFLISPSGAHADLVLFLFLAPSLELANWSLSVLWNSVFSRYNLVDICPLISLKIALLMRQNDWNISQHLLPLCLPIFLFLSLLCNHARFQQKVRLLFVLLGQVSDTFKFSKVPKVDFPQVYELQIGPLSHDNISQKLLHTLVHLGSKGEVNPCLFILLFLSSSWAILIILLPKDKVLDDSPPKLGEDRISLQLHRGL
jgi:hypothetical protein